MDEQKDMMIEDDIEDDWEPCAVCGDNRAGNKAGFHQDYGIYICPVCVEFADHIFAMYGETITPEQFGKCLSRIHELFDF